MRCSSLLTWLLALPVLAAVPEPSHRPDQARTLDLAMEDGVQLRTRVLLPEGEGPFPTLLTRMPYPMKGFMDKRCRTFNRHGYACVHQEVRGRGHSQGDFEPFVHERADGSATIAWIRSQSWSDGQVALFGESYLGATQWTLAWDRPEGLVTIMPTVMGTDMHDLSFQGGLFRHDVATAWMSLMPGSEFRYVSGPRHYRRALRHRPRAEMDLVSTGAEVPWVRRMLEAQDADHPEWEAARDFIGHPEQTELPVLSMGGWSDAFLGPQLDTWSRLASQDRSTLVIGPWDHLSTVRADVRQHGLDDEIGLDGDYFQLERVLDWLGHHMKGEPLDHPVGGVVAYVVNGGGWTWHQTWPPPSEPRVLHLAPGQDPQRCTGLLSAEGAAGEVGFTYDPDHPTPTVGGAGLLGSSFPLWGGPTPGFVDQKRLCQRREDLVGFASAPLTEPLHLAGSPRARLVFSTDAPDTAVGFRLLEERADGKRIHVREAYRALSDVVDAYEPGTEVVVDLEAWPVEYVLEAGSRVLVEVASASFPKLEAHSNTAEPWAEAVEVRRAAQTVHLEGSWVELPVLSSP